MNKLAPYSCIPKNAVNGFGLSYTQINYNAELVATTEQNFVVPEYINGGAGLVYEQGPSYLIMFRIGPSTGDTWLAINDTAVIPSGSIALSSSMMITDKDSLFVFSNDVISLRATQDVNISMRFYELT